MEALLEIAAEQRRSIVPEDQRIAAMAAMCVDQLGLS